MRVHDSGTCNMTKVEGGGEKWQERTNKRNDRCHALEKQSKLGKQKRNKGLQCPARGIRLEVI